MFALNPPRLPVILILVIVKNNTCFYTLFSLINTFAVGFSLAERNLLSLPRADKKCQLSLGITVNQHIHEDTYTYKHTHTHTLSHTRTLTHTHIDKHSQAYHLASVWAVKSFLIPNSPSSCSPLLCLPCAHLHLTYLIVFTLQALPQALTPPPPLSPLPTYVTLC